MQFLHVTSPGSSAIVTSPRPHRVRLLPLRLRAWMVRGGSPRLALAASVARCSPCIGSGLQCSQGIVHGRGVVAVVRVEAVLLLLRAVAALPRMVFAHPCAVHVECADPAALS